MMTVCMHDAGQHIDLTDPGTGRVFRMCRICGALEIDGRWYHPQGHDGVAALIASATHGPGGTGTMVLLDDQITLQLGNDTRRCRGIWFGTRRIGAIDTLSLEVSADRPFPTITTTFTAVPSVMAGEQHPTGTIDMPPDTVTLTMSDRARLFVGDTQIVVDHLNLAMHHDGVTETVDMHVGLMRNLTPDRLTPNLRRALDASLARLARLPWITVDSPDDRGTPPDGED